ncbi:MAG: DUF3108 domain-containing protein [Gammaproteobacteria bacterium]|nr:DUF3108 domain-containing protein [Gammaproteobacteria bacterium]MBV9621271.1 DUF3108 domain-containing protein [Gammaproteobacteria bacterium]
MRPAERAASLLLALAAVFAVDLAHADELQPFEASYHWIWHGMTVAASTVTLARAADDTWHYSSKSEPRGIGRAFSERPRQMSVLRVTPHGVQPLSYDADDGTGSSKRTVKLRFDWQTQRVTGIYEEAPIDLGLKDDVQDDSSVQVALMEALLRGVTPSHFTLVDKTGLREYRYAREGEATLATALGRIPTVIYRSERANSPRVTRFWCAPQQGYVPLRVEQKRGDDVQWTMEITQLRRE